MSNSVDFPISTEDFQRDAALYGSRNGQPGGDDNPPPNGYSSNMEARFVKIEGRLDGIDNRLNGIEKRLDTIGGEVSSLRWWVVGTMIAALGLATTIILHESNRNWEVAQKALERGTEASIRVEAARLAQERQGKAAQPPQK